ncbi:PQQ-binding-like beta-propeller repeat protein [Nucisporomicrobium flavum]|uniref:outer membrane protein assembly factor BamB family protein n=1 Tax=Nucisporomicrobium flavum TaxID=2785915 RepID=UPI003C2B0FB5
MIRRLWAAVAVLILAVPLTGPAAAAPASTWPQVGSDAGRSYYNANEDAVNASTVSKLKLRWQVPPSPSECPGMVGPVVAGGLTLTQDTAGLVARESATGRLAWRDTGIFTDRLAYHIVVSGTTVVVASSDSLCMIEGGDADGLVVAFDLASGRQLWQRSPNTDAAQLVVTRGVVIVSGNDYATSPNVEAYRLSDGTSLWSNEDPDGPRTLFSTVPVLGDVLISMHRQMETWRVDAVTGQPRGGWSASWTPLASYGDWMFVGDSSDWSLKAVRLSTDAVVWSMDRVSNRVATDGRRLYLGVGSVLEAYDVASGKRIWSVDLGGRVGQPVRAGGLVYAPVAGKPVAVRNASTGVKVTPSSALSKVSTVAAVGGGRLFGTTASGLGVFGL